MVTAYSYSDQKPRPELRNGDHMKQEEFHNIYEQMPEAFKAELVDGTVFVAMPLGKPHAMGHARLAGVFDAYSAHTIGTEVLIEATTILGTDDEVQPDLQMRISPAYKGQSRDSHDRYVLGAPELICEIAYSSKAIDLHMKRKRYESAGVCEYIVFCLEPRQVCWFDFANKTRTNTGEDGILRSRVFPGFWLSHQGLLDLDYEKLMSVINLGLASKEHAEFCACISLRKEVD
jgi:Uma2 family endonuclease